jgi:tetratricopeptide (TPR) repeat protein
MRESARAPTAWTIAVGLALAVNLASLPAGAIMGDEEIERAPASDPDYAAGVAAFDQGDWQGVLDNMTKVIERRPWHDNAHNLIGFAYRKLGDYDRSLEFYDKALELNPHNRGALEYLGEAYLDLDRPEQAEAMLERLETECQRIAPEVTDGGWKSGCEEWQDLKAAYDAYLADGRSSEEGGG